MSKLAGIVAVFLATFNVCLMVVADGDPGNDALCPLTPGQPIADTLVTSYLSVDGSGIVQCGMQYMVPDNATLYQGMLLASQQHPDFEFTSTIDKTYGHYIVSINNVLPMNNDSWFVFDNGTAPVMTTPVGVDFIKVKSGSSYIWHYTTYTSHNMTYTGPCVGSSFTPPTMPLTYKIMYLTVTNANDMNFKNVCKQLVLFSPETISVFRILEIANLQIPISVKAELNLQDNTVTSFNNVSNSGSFRWVGYKAGMPGPIPDDLSMTDVTDGDRIKFGYEDDAVNNPDNGAPSGRSIALLTLAGLLANVVTSL